MIEKTNNEQRNIIRAIKDGKSDIVEIALRSGVDPNTVNDNGESLLHVAVRKNNYKAAELLLRYGATVGSRNKSAGYTPLHAVAKENRLDFLNLLLKYASAADINKQDFVGRTALHLAARHDNTELVETLIKRDTIINKQDNNGWTPLHMAINRGNINVVDLLIAHCASLEVQDKTGETPLHMALRLKHYRAADFLIEKGADLEVKSSGAGITAMQVVEDPSLLIKELIENKQYLPYLCEALLQKHRLNLNDAFFQGFGSLLHIAVGVNQIKMVHFLLNHGIDINAANPSGRTALHIAAITGNETITHTLLAHGADVQKQDASGKTALQKATERGQTRIVNLLSNPLAVKEEGVQNIHSRVIEQLKYRKMSLKVTKIILSNEKELEKKIESDKNIDEKLEEITNCNAAVQDDKIAASMAELFAIQKEKFNKEQETLLEEASKASDELIKRVDNLKSYIKSLEAEHAQIKGVETGKENREALKAVEIKKLKIILDEQEEKRRILEARKLIFANQELRDFYTTMQSKLNDAYLAAMVIKSGKVSKKESSYRKLGKAAAGMLNPMGAEALQAIFIIYDRAVGKKKQIYYITDLALGAASMESFAEILARNVTIRYESFIKAEQSTHKEDRKNIKNKIMDSEGATITKQRAISLVSKLLEHIINGEVYNISEQQQKLDILNNLVDQSKLFSGVSIDVPYIMHRENSEQIHYNNPVSDEQNLSWEQRFKMLSDRVDNLERRNRELEIQLSAQSIEIAELKEGKTESLSIPLLLRSPRSEHDHRLEERVRQRRQEMLENDGSLRAP